MFDTTDEADEAAREAAIIHMREDPRIVELRRGIESAVEGLVAVVGRGEGDAEVADVSVAMRSDDISSILSLVRSDAYVHALGYILLAETRYIIFVDPHLSIALTSSFIGLYGMRKLSIGIVDVIGFYFNSQSECASHQFRQEIGEERRSQTARGG